MGELELEHYRNSEVPRMLPLYAARIEDLRPGDFVKVDCAACHPADAGSPAEGQPEPRGQVLDLKGRFRCRGCGRKGRAVVSVRFPGRARERWDPSQRDGG